MMTSEEIKKAYRPDQKAQEAIWAHACATLSNFDMVLDLMEEMEEDSSFKPEICVTKDTEAGVMGLSFGIGFYLRGDVTIMARGDIQSGTGIHGSRTIKESCIEHLVTRYEDLTPYGGFCPYTESWLIPREIVGVWVLKDRKISEKWIRRHVGDLPITYI